MIALLQKCLDQLDDVLIGGSNFILSAEVSILCVAVEEVCLDENDLDDFEDDFDDLNDE